MLEYLKKVLGEHLIIVVLIVVLAPFTTISVVSLFFAREHEIVYDLRKVYAECGFAGTPEKDCVARYEMVIGNTGLQEEPVRLVWPFDISVWDRDQQVLNIAADNPRGQDPHLTCETRIEQSTCVIENFAPGSMLVLKFTCLGCSSQDSGMLEEKPVNVETEATVSRGDPRVTSFLRRLQNLLNVII